MPGTSGEAKALDSMLLLVDGPTGYAATGYTYAGGEMAAFYRGADSSDAVYDDLEVIVVPSAGAENPCSVDWSAPDHDIAPNNQQLSCTADGTGRWALEDSVGDFLYVGEYHSDFHGYFAALAVNSYADDPVSPSELPAIFATVHPANPTERASLESTDPIPEG
jgi:hypothetical protein